MGKCLHRATYEKLDDGIVTYAQCVSSDDGWPDAIAHLADQFFGEMVCGELLLRLASRKLDSVATPDEAQGMEKTIERWISVADEIMLAGTKRNDIDGLRSQLADMCNPDGDWWKDE